MTDPASKASLLCLVFTDLVDSTALKTRMGDEAAGELIGRYQDRVRGLMTETAGREIDSAGDGFFLTFDTPSAGVGFALRLQGIHESEPDLPSVRVGIHLGEVTERPAPPGSSKPMLVEGLAVDLAARIGALAQPSQVLMSAPVFNSGRQRLKGRDFGREISWCAHGPYLLKGIDDPVQIGEVGFEGVSPLEAPPDSEKGRSALAAGDELTLGWRPAVGLAIPGREHWKLEEQLGSGAIGEVWLASHEKTHARRVFKFCFEADRLRSLKREVVLLRLLKEHLGERDDIAQVIDWEFDHPPYFLEMEHTEAGDLVEWARQQGGIGKVALETRLEIVAKMAVALDAAHHAGVLHRDLKPANVLISHEDPTAAPRVCLTDFGIGLVTSRQALEVPGVTVEGLTDVLLSSGASTGAGTRLYMAPEVIEGREATPLSDIYSLGVVLYQVAAGDFSHALAPGWERGVADDLLRDDIAACIDGEPEERLRSARELALRLRSRDERHAALRARRVRRLVAIGSAVAAVLVVVVVLGFRAIQQASRVSWARQTGMPEVMRLIEAEDYVGAFSLAREVEEVLPSDSVLAGLWSQMSSRSRSRPSQ